ncbi:MAG: hypothetical protein AAFU66_05425 [Pseudomonadota bacterium]
MGLVHLAAAQPANDPFALLFPDERGLDVSRDDRPGNDSLQIVSVSLRGRDLLDSTPIYSSSLGPCLPLRPIVDALQFAITVDDASSTASGWFITENRTIAVDFEANLVEFNGRAIPLHDGAALQTDAGWCLSLSTLSDLFPIDFDYDQRTLSIKARPREVLPVEARLEREARRRELSRRRVPGLVRYRTVQNPHRWISWPAADITLNGRAGSGGALLGRYSVDGAGDLLKTTARLGLTGGSDRSIEQVRFSLQRSSETKTELGPLKARRFALGDVAAPILPLLADLQPGRGIHISSKQQSGTDLFNATTIRGPMPEGWEAELHDGEQLLAFALDRDPQGNYVFDDVVLQPGLNIFEVRLFGPFGETETRDVRYFIGSELNPENEVTYEFGVIEPNKTVIGMGQVVPGQDEATFGSGGSLFDDLNRENASGPLLYSSLEKGISERLSFRIDAVSEFSQRVERDYGIAASAFFSLGGTFGAVRLASDGQGIPAVEASLQRRLFRSTTLRGRLAEFGDLQNSYTGRGGNRVVREGSLRAATNVLFNRRSVPIQTSVGWQNFASGLKRFQAASRIATSVARTNLSHTLRFITSSADAMTTRSANGEWLASRSIGGIRARGGVTYDLAPDTRLRTLSVSGQSAVSAGIAQFGLQHDLVGGDTEAVASWSRTIGPAILSTTAGWRRSGSWNIGVNLAFSLFKPSDRRRPALGPPGLSRAGSIRLTAFEDIDGDRVLGAADKAIQNAQFIVQDSLRNEGTGPNGTVVLGGLSAGRPLNVELRTSSLDDPFLTPVELGRTISVRPGQVVDIAFPLLATGDVEGIIKVQNGDVQIAVSGVTVQAVSEFGEIVGETRSEFDGYVYIPDLPLGRYRLQVAPEDLARVNGQAPSVPFMLSADAPSAFGVDMLIDVLAAPETSS